LTIQLKTSRELIYYDIDQALTELARPGRAQPGMKKNVRETLERRAARLYSQFLEAKN
jgi:hypothetical protein